MKRCLKCDKFFQNNVDFCSNCNSELVVYKKTSRGGRSKDYYRVIHSKSGMGVLFCFLFGIPGIFGLFMYPSDSYERQSFIKGWRNTLIVTVILLIVMLIIYFVVIMRLFTY